jgi:hypothetical protein
MPERCGQSGCRWLCGRLRTGDTPHQRRPRPGSGAAFHASRTVGATTRSEIGSSTKSRPTRCQGQHPMVDAPETARKVTYHHEPHLLAQILNKFPRAAITQPLAYFSLITMWGPTMHPDLLYMMLKQEAEQQRRQAKHSHHLSYALRAKKRRSLVLRVRHWLGLGSVSALTKTDYPGPKITAGCHDDHGASRGTEDDIDYTGSSGKARAGV